MRRLSFMRPPAGSGQEAGAVVVIVAILVGFGVVLGFGAIVIDVGALHQERRVVQNGADAASLALAKICADDSTDPKCQDPDFSSVAKDYLQGLAGENAADTFTDILSVCGGGSVESTFGGCPAPIDHLTDCVLKTIPSGTDYVEVRTRTKTDSGGTLLKPFLAQALGDNSYSGAEVRACARAIWGPPTSGFPTIPVTISLCEWNALTTTGTNFIAPGPFNDPYQLPDVDPGGPYPGDPLTFERRLLLHDTTGSTTCTAGPSGADLPGGFGWLETSSDCEVNIPATGWVDDDPGNSPPAGCDMAPLVGQIVYIPIFLNTNGLGGQNGSYLLNGFAAFYFTGYSIPNDRPHSIATDRSLCTPSQTCLYGWFTKGVIPVGEFLLGGAAGGTPRGAIAVSVAG